jgi:hypothetical protein
MSGATMKSTHVGMKTYYVYDRTGTLLQITTRAYYVKELNQDLLGGSAQTAADYRVILDKNDDIAVIYPVRDDGTIDAANRFPFVSEYPRDACSIFGPNQSTHQNICEVVGL